MKISEVAMGFFILCSSLYCLIALFADFNSSMKVCMQKYQVLNIDDRVPLGFRQFCEGPEFCSIFIKLKTHSSPALLWGMHNINISTID